MYMKCLPNIEITKEQLKYVKQQISFDSGAESLLYELPSIFGSRTVAKIWKNGRQEVIQNKFKKIERLYQIEELKKINDIRILKSISCNGEIIGYLTNRVFYQSMAKVSITRIEILKYLLLARQKLQQFLDLGILYGDISDKNILVSKNAVCFCDLDNVAYQELEMDINPRILDYFLSDYGKLDEKAISYMYNIFTIKELCSLKEDFKVERYFDTIRIPRELSPVSYEYIKEQMQNVTPRYTGLYFIDYVKDRYKEKVKKTA